MNEPNDPYAPPGDHDAAGNPYAAPAHGLDRHAVNDETRGRDFVYMGFWVRVLASIIDNVLIGVACWPLLLVFGRNDAETNSTFNVLEMVISVSAVLLFWNFKQSTPGKMVFGGRIVDAETYGKPSFGQLVLRYVGYIPSFVIFCGGFLWVAIDRKKRGWHDLMAGTVVVIPRARTAPRVSRTIRRPPPKAASTHQP